MLGPYQTRTGIDEDRYQERMIMAVKPGQLAVVSTPIGNLGDLSPRAAEFLEKADILALSLIHI